MFLRSANFLSSKHRRQETQVTSSRVSAGHGMIFPSTPGSLYAFVAPRCERTVIVGVYPCDRAKMMSRGVSHEASTLILPQDSRLTLSQACVYVQTFPPPICRHVRSMNASVFAASSVLASPATLHEVEGLDHADRRVLRPAALSSSHPGT